MDLTAKEVITEWVNELEDKPIEITHAVGQRKTGFLEKTHRPVR